MLSPEVCEVNERNWWALRKSPQNAIILPRHTRPCSWPPLSLPPMSGDEPAPWRDAALLHRRAEVDEGTLAARVVLSAKSKTSRLPGRDAWIGRAPGARGSHGARLLWHEGSHVDLCTI